MPLQATSGAASYDAFGGGVAVVPNYIEDVFSTYLYSGNNSTQTITNGIDLSTKGGLVWTKSRNEAFNHYLADTARGVTKGLAANDISAQTTDANGVTAFGATGYTIGDLANINSYSPRTYVSWTFREQAKFFDIVTYTGTGGARTINHSLGSAAGCIMIKCTSTASNWMVWHTSISGQNNLYLNSTAGTSGVAADPISVNGWPSSPSTTTFNVDAGTDSCNTVGETYVAYLFAHDAGGFGLTGNDNVISCGSFTNDASGNATVTLGYEPQWIMYKRTDAVGNWVIIDSMRGLTVGADSLLFPNSNAAEDATGNNVINPTATGFYTFLNPSTPYIYIAIRRGPMKVPTLGTTVYNAIARSGTGAAATVTGVGFPPDSVWPCVRNNPGNGTFIYDRLRGANASLNTPSTGAENTGTTTALTAFGMDGFTLGSNNIVNESGSTFINWCFQRAPSFFDEVCYTGTGPTSQALTHNLGVQPTLIIVKARDLAGQEWAVQINGDGTKLLKLNSTAAIVTNNAYWNDTNSTSTTFTVGPNAGLTNNSGTTYVAYLFATCAGVSKVGSYTGTATTKQVDCGFTGGARFVLIKRTDSTGDWYVYDSARGIVSGNDPYLLLNSTAAEVTGTDYVDTYNAGFELSSTAPAALNANGGTYIFLAIA